MSLVRHHRVRPGENLAVISQHYYGTPHEALAIYQANRHIIADPNTVYTDQLLVIPHLVGGVHHR